MFDCLASQQSDNENIFKQENEEKIPGLNVSPFFVFLLSNNTSMIVIQQSQSNEVILWNQSSKGSVIIFKLSAKIPKYDN